MSRATRSLPWFVVLLATALVVAVVVAVVQAVWFVAAS
jgi:hypothetical protein